MANGEVFTTVEVQKVNKVHIVGGNTTTVKEHKGPINLGDVMGYAKACGIKEFKVAVPSPTGCVGKPLFSKDFPINSDIVIQENNAPKA